MAGSWDFTADSEIQTELSNNLNEAADKFDSRVSDMYKEIDSLGSNNYWVGEDYNEFNTGTREYENALKDLSEGIRMYGKHFSEMASGTDTLATELISIVQNMTGSGNGGGATGGTTGGTSGGSSGTSTGGGTTGNSSDDGNAGDGGTTNGDNGDSSTSADTNNDGTNNSTDEGGSSNNVAEASLDESKEIDEAEFMGSTTYNQWSSTGGTYCSLNEDNSIYYQNGKIYYPDGHYERKNLSNMYDLKDAYADVQSYTYDPNQTQQMTGNIDQNAESATKVNVTYDDFMGSTTFAQWQSSTGSSCYLDDSRTIEYDNGKILYPDGRYEEATLSTMDDLKDAWVRVNNYNYEE